MNPTNEKPRIIVKSKNLQIVIDNCIEQKTEFTVIPRNTSNDEWEVELNIKTISNAIEWGMFMKANKLELVANVLFNKPVIPVQKPKIREKKSPVISSSTQINNEEDDETETAGSTKKLNDQTNVLSFD
jgi:hypothetical protein